MQDESIALLLALLKQGDLVRHLLIDSQSFEQIVALHAICASLRPDSSPDSSEIEALGRNLTPKLVRGYQRLPYIDRARILTCILIGCSDMKSEKASNMMNGCLSAVEKSFQVLVNALE